MTVLAADQIDDLLGSLFGADHDCRRDGLLLTGEGRLDDRRVAVVGTVDRARIGARLALALSRSILDVMRDAPGRPILVIVDNAGQQLSLWDELVGNNGYVAHLGKCLDLARRRGHPVVGIVVDLAVSAGFMATGMATGRCYALADAELRLMAPSAMARVMRIPQERLAELFRESPALGPGVDNFVRIGALHGLLDKDGRRQILEAISGGDSEDDPRARLGQERGGRVHAAKIAAMVRNGRES